MRSRPTFLITCLAALAVGTGVVGCSTGPDLGPGSAEYSTGWSAADSQFARMPESHTVGQKVRQCNGSLKPGRAKVEFPLTQVPEEYTEHQRQLFAHGCLDYLRSSTDVPAQPWER